MSTRSQFKKKLRIYSYVQVRDSCLVLLVLAVLITAMKK